MVHDRSGAKCLLLKPPDAELLLIHIAAINDLVVAIHIAPKFIREVKSIRAVNSDAMFAIKSGVRNLNVAGFFPAG
jgi:hypothetical protein